jgi:ABC-2 type transport system permease protein
MKINLTILGFIKKELTQTLRDPRMALLIFIAPIIQLTIFGIAISSDVKNIKLAVACRPGDQLCQRIEEHALASGWFVPVDEPLPEDGDYAALLSAKKAEAVLVPPPQGLKRQMERGACEIQLLIDATNATRAQQVESYVKMIVADVLTDKSMPQNPAPVKLDLRVLYNPSLESSIFMVPGVMAMLLCLITVIVTSMSISKERETGTFETLISAPVTPAEILAGKTIPYVLLGILEIPIIMAAAIFIFGVPVRGPVLMLGAAGFIFVCTTVMVGVMISTFARSQQQAMMGGFMFLFPSILLSGIMFPVENMPFGFRLIAYIDPLTYFARLLRNIMLKGGDMTVFWHNTAALAALFIVIASVSVARFRARLN